MTLKLQIQDDMKAAMRARDQARLNAIRLLQAAIKQREIDDRIELDDMMVIETIEKMLKQRRDSINQYQAAHRQDLVDQEQFEVSVLKTYMPQALSVEALDQVVTQAITELGVNDIKNMGQVIAHLRPKLAGTADMAQVSMLVKAKLGKPV